MQRVEELKEAPFWGCYVLPFWERFGLPFWERFGLPFLGAFRASSDDSEQVSYSYPYSYV